MVTLGVLACLGVIVSIVVPAWPAAPEKPLPKPTVIGYDKTGKLIYERPKRKIDVYA